MASMALSATEDKFDAITPYPLASYEWPQNIFWSISPTLNANVSPQVHFRAHILGLKKDMTLNWLNTKYQS